jgi:PAS domain S-box-containing protein
MKATFLVFLLLLSHTSLAVTAIPINLNESYNLAQEVEYLMDETNSLELLDLNQNPNWKRVERNIVNFGFINPTLWLRFKVIAQVEGDWVLHISYPPLDHIESTGIVNGIVGKTIITGDLVNFSTRPINNPGFAFPYKLSKYDVLEVYLKVKTDGAAEIPLNLMSQSAFIEKNIISNFLKGWIYGVLVIMFFYNIFIYFVIRENTYLYYVICILTNLAIICVFDGTGFQIIWPNSPQLNPILFSLIYGAVQVANLLFIIEFLQIYSRKSWYKYYFKYLLISLCSLPLLSPFISYQTIVSIEVFGSLIVNLSAIFIGLYLSIKGETLARLFTLAWSTFLFGLICSNLKSLGLLPSNWFTVYAFQFGTIIHVTLLSMALAYRIDSVNKEKTAAQKESIKHLKQYQILYKDSLSGQFRLDTNGALLNVNPAFYKMLGYSSESELLSLPKDVRNKSLNIKYNEFEILLEKLKHKDKAVSFETQLTEKSSKRKWYSISMKGVKDSSGSMKYYEGSMIGINELKENELIKINTVTEKSIALEHIVIGICHEMNTPLGVANTSLSYLNCVNKDLNSILKSGKITKSKFGELLDDENKAITLINENLDRLNNLIKKFRNISILQKNYELLEFNLKSIINNQLLSKKDSLENISITVSCPADIKVNSYPQALSDIFMQLINNSIRHGFANKAAGEINISAKIDSDYIAISYGDNGAGLSLKEHKEIFNPFYTTKRGSTENIGLGMFQVYNIVTQLLNGEITIRDVNQGFELLIRFPVNST